MSCKAKKCAVVFFILVAFATQAYSIAFSSSMPAAVQMMSADHHATFNHSRCDDINDRACTDRVAESACCDESAECSFVHCSSMVACVVYSFYPDINVTPMSLSAGSEHVLPLLATSLYRPPILN